MLIVLAFGGLLQAPDALSESASGSRIIEVAFIGAALCLTLAMRGTKVAIASRAARDCLTVVLLFATWAFLSSFWSALPLTAAVKAMELGAIALVAHGLAVTATGQGAERRLRVCDTVALGLCLAILVLLCVNVQNWHTPLHISNGEESDSFNPFNTSTRPRLSLGFLHPLSSGLLIAMTIAFTLNTSLSAVAKGAAVCSLGTLLWLCDARGVTVGLTVATFATFFLNARPSMLKSWFGFAVILTILGGGSLAAIYVDFGTLVANGVGEGAATLNGRTDLWAYAFERALDNAPLGVGYYATRLQLLAAFPFAGHAHNSFLEIFISTGLVGAFLFVAFLVLCFARLARTLDPLLGAVLPVLLIEGNLNPVLFTPGLAMLLLMIALFVAEEPAMRRLRTGPQPVGRGRA